MVAGLKFFLGADEENEGSDSDSEESTDDCIDLVI